MRLAIHIFSFLVFALAVVTAKAVSIPVLAPQKDSIVTTYYDNGNVKEKQRYRKGEKHGKWITYDENGALLKVVKYKRGMFWWEKLYKKGKLSQIRNRKGKVTKMKECGC